MVGNTIETSKETAQGRVPRAASVDAEDVSLELSGPRRVDRLRLTILVGTDGRVVESDPASQAGPCDTGSINGGTSARAGW